MANIIDYLDWRDDISFTMSPFNDIDNLVLSAITYTPLDEICNSLTDNESISLSKAAALYFKKNPIENIPEEEKHFLRSAFLLKKASNTKRFGKIRITNYINEIIPESEVQFSAMTFILPDHSAYIAFRGTDQTIVGWQEDFNMSFKNQTSGQIMAVDYINKIAVNFKAIRVGGHSKGGNFSVYGAAFSNSSVRDKLINIYSNDGPGFREEILSSPKYIGILDKIISIIPEQSMVGMILGNEYNHKIVRSSANGMMQHDVFSWQLIGNNFETLQEPGVWSKVFNGTLNEWLKGVSDEDREQFVSIVFNSMAEEAGSSASSIPDSGKIIMAIGKHLKDLPKNKQTLFFDILSKLAKSWKEALTENFSLPF
ncbi:MAG: DUF2974 domain-containing protein [Lachnospiraceae bacterium]|nr:DUF2974 domain-containing protein [Lachnospiraceae bacterium]